MEEENTRKRQKSCSNEEYFSSYEELSVHELMLKDKPRTEAYLNSFKLNDFKDKIVLDVGAGTGILSMFAARQGAQRVYAVEGSKISSIAHSLVTKNGYDGIIQVINGLIEEIELPEKVDIIISEWMGFYLLHESMLESVLIARDRWLKTGGRILPDRAKIFLAPISMDLFYQSKFDFWNEIYGFDFSPVIPLAMKQALSKPEISIVSSDQILSSPLIVEEIDLYTVVPEYIQNIYKVLSFIPEKDGNLHGFCCWFTVEFEGELEGSNVILSTAPGDPDTHWKQTVFLLPKTIQANKGVPIHCRIQFSIDEQNTRRYNVILEMQESDSDIEQEDEDPPDCECGRCRLMRALMLQDQ